MLHLGDRVVKPVPSVAGMSRLRKSLLALPAIPVAYMATQVLKTARRPDLPSLGNQDISGRFGSPDLPPLRIVAVGDSSLTAPGVKNLDNVWLRRIAIELSDRHRVDLVSLAVGGSKARDVIEGQLAGAVRLGPDLAIVSVGGNDALRGVPLRRYRREIREILERLSATGAGVMVFGMGDLGSIPRLTPSLQRWASRRSQAFDRAAHAAAVRVPGVVKVHTRGRSSSAFFDDPGLFADDQFHAGDAGHGVFADDAREAVAAALALREIRRR